MNTATVLMLPGKLNDEDLAVLDSQYDRLKPYEVQAFFRLFDAGEIVEGSPSDADHKLLCMLAQLTRDPEQIERIARASQLARTVEVYHEGRLVGTVNRAPKWERRDYVKRSIAAALAKTREIVLRVPQGGQPIQARTLADICKAPDALKPPTAILPHFAWRGRLTVYAALDKSGKSTFTSAAVAAFTRGQRFLDGAAQPPGTALWVMLEEHQSELAIRAKLFGADPQRLVVFELKPTIEDLRREIAAYGADVVVIDPLLRWAAERVTDSGRAEQWRPVMDELRQTARDCNVAVVVLHHARKSDGDARDSTEITANADVILTQRERFKPEDCVQRIAVRGRWTLNDFAVRLVDGKRYELVSGMDTTQALTPQQQQAYDALVGSMTHGAWWKASQIESSGSFHRVLTGLLGRQAVLHDKTKDLYRRNPTWET